MRPQHVPAWLNHSHTLVQRLPFSRGVIMPIDTSGGKVHIEGGYNDVARDMYNYRDNSRHTNSHNVKSSRIKGSFNDSSLNKHSSNSRVIQTTQPTKRRIPQQRGKRAPRSEVQSEAAEDDSGHHLEFRGRQPNSEHDEIILTAAYRILAERERMRNAAVEVPHPLDDPFLRTSQSAPPFNHRKSNPFVPLDSTCAHTGKDSPRNPFMRQ